MTLDELAHQEPNPSLWTDKKSATPGYTCHDYLNFYEREWGKWRKAPITIMEIGLNKGASIKLWLQYFIKALVYGVDIAPFKNEVGIEAAELSRFHFEQGDQSDTKFWNDFLGRVPPLDIVIDDGCHFSGPIQVAFHAIWPKVVPGGYYVIEDISEVLNPESHTPGFMNQAEFVQKLAHHAIMGLNNIDEMMIRNEVCMLRKK